MVGIILLPEVKEEFGDTVVADSTAGPWSHPDALRLRAAADALGVPYRYAYAIAWRETRNNDGPWTRGAHGEYGRFQILPSTARSRCPGIDVGAYDGNVLCFMKLAREDLSACRGDVRCAARVHNGSGPRARAYADTVSAIVRDLYERGLK